MLIEVASDNFAIIPTELYRQELIEPLFIAKSLNFDSAHYSYHTEEISDMTIIVGCRRSLVMLSEAIFAKVSVRHSLSLAASMALTKGALCFSLSNNRCAISIAASGKLVFVESLPILSDFDVIYYINNLISGSNLSHDSIYCISNPRLRNYKLITQHTKAKIIYENS